MERKTNFIFEVESEDMTHKIQPLSLNNDDNADTKSLKVRLDKWLWAARFFKTRALARSAIENGYVYYEGEKTVPGKEITIGASITINQGRAKTVIVCQLCTRRRNTDEANTLFKYVSREEHSAPKEHIIVNMHTKQKTGTRQQRITRFLRRTLALDEPQE